MSRVSFPNGRQLLNAGENNAVSNLHVQSNLHVPRTTKENSREETVNNVSVYEQL